MGTAELALERYTMEQDIAQKEAEIKIINEEIKKCVTVLNTLVTALKKLEYQKIGDENKRNVLKVQVDKLRQETEEQERSLCSQEEELKAKRLEVKNLKQLEQEMESHHSKVRDHLSKLTRKLKEQQIQITQAKLKSNHLEQEQRQMNDAVELYDFALAANDVDRVPDAVLHFKPEIEELVEEGRRSSRQANGVKNEEDVFSNTNVNVEAFGANPFASNKAKDVFKYVNPFDESTFPSQGATSLFGNDAFTSFNNQGATKDAFHPFGVKGGASSNNGYSFEPGFAGFGNFYSRERIILPDFTENPFRGHRYENVFNIDPFADFDHSTNQTITSNTGELGAFRVDQHSHTSNDNFLGAFDSDYSRTLPLPISKSGRSTSKEAEFGNSDTNRNDFAFSTWRSKPIDLRNMDETFAPKYDTKSGGSSHFSFGDKSVFGEQKLYNISSKAWNRKGRSLEPKEGVQLK